MRWPTPAPGRASRAIILALALAAALAPAAAPAAPPVAAASPPEALGRFLDRHCFECHDPEAKKGDLDLTALGFDLDLGPGAAANFATWVKVHDRVASGEMPPEKKPRPPAEEREAFTAALAEALTAADRARIAREGRAVQRRLNRHEYEATLRDLLQLPWLQVAHFLPEDSEAHGFNKVGEALDLSHVNLARYLAASEHALRAAMAPQAARPETTVRRFHTWGERHFTGKITLGGPKVRRTWPVVDYELQTEIVKAGRTRLRPAEDGATRGREAMVVLVSSYEPTEVRFGNFRAPVSGRYRLAFSAYSVWMGPRYGRVSPGRRPEPITVYADAEPRILRRIGGFDVAPEPTVGSFEAYLLAGESIRPDAARLHRSRPPDHKNPDQIPEGMPGVAFQWMEVEGPLLGAADAGDPAGSTWPPAGHRLLFGELPMADRPRPAEPREEERPGWGGRRRGPRWIPPPGVDITSAQPAADTERLLRRFMARAYRRPVAEAEVARFLRLAEGAREAGHSFTDALLAAYTGVLSSPGFLFFSEKPGALDELALAERLSFFLCNAAPDTTLRKVAAAGELRDPEALAAQVDRLLDNPRSRRFVDAFLDYWLDLRLIAGTAPDAQLYPDYQLDDLLVESMTEETQLYFAEMVRRDLGARHLVASDFAFLNGRLADHYGIERVDGMGVALRPVALDPGGVRGGFLTQASVLKVTANGTTTSPVMRGAWVMDRLLGKPPPPPPAAVPAVDPDTRGTTTIRDQLAKHRDAPACNACHLKIDPPGFALESFDVMGGWRERYRSLGQGERVKGIGHNGLYYHFRLGPPVDPSGHLPGAGPFEDVRGLRRLLLQDEAQLARNLARQLIVYATGAPVGFSDRAEVERILGQTRAAGFGARSLIHAIVQSRLFREK